MRRPTVIGILLGNYLIKEDLGIHASVCETGNLHKKNFSGRCSTLNNSVLQNLVISLMTIRKQAVGK